jgi:hypothetical protein
MEIMKMKRKLLLTMVALGFSLLINPLSTRAQSTDLPRYEVGADFTSLKLDRFTTLPGLGGRFTANLNKHLALEAAGYFFPGHCEFCNGSPTGHVVEGLFGVKVGQRFKKWGVFGKARPGFASFAHRAFNVSPLTVGGTSRGQIQCYGPASAGTLPCFRIEENRLNAAALDLGAVVEFYPSKRIVVRVDGGDTILGYTQRSFNTLTVDPAHPTSGIPILVNVTDRGGIQHRLQFTAGVGFRF